MALHGSVHTVNFALSTPPPTSLLWHSSLVQVEVVSSRFPGDGRDGRVLAALTLLCYISFFIQAILPLEISMLAGSRIPEESLPPTLHSSRSGEEIHPSDSFQFVGSDGSSYRAALES